MKAKDEPNLDELQNAANEVARWTTKRNALVLLARLDGWPWDNIADVTGMHRNSVEKIAMRENGGVRPVPVRRLSR